MIVDLYPTLRRRLRAPRAKPMCATVCRRAAAALLPVVTMLCALTAQAANGAWTKVSMPAPTYTGTMLLLSDGTVMVQEYSNGWMRLTPDAKGSYINGTWSTLASMSTPRLYMSSQVLPSGEVWVAGGEYSGTGLPLNWGAGAETYNPATNQWTTAATFPAQTGCPYIDDFGGAITAGSSMMTGILTTADFQPGWYLLGPGLAQNTTIASVVSNTEIRLSSPATASYPFGTDFYLFAVSTGTLTAGSDVITGIPSTKGYEVGWPVYATGAPVDATITKVNSLHEITISKDVTLSATNEEIEFLVTMKRNTCMGDDSSIMLAPNKILVADPFTKGTYFYDPATNTYSTAASKTYNDVNDEEGWVKLGNGSILTYDIYQTLSENAGYAELYNPTLNKWSGISPSDGSAHGTLPVLTNTAAYEIGPVIRLLDGRIFQVGANGLTALYTPSTNTWAEGPKMNGTINGQPFLYVADDAPAAILPTGHVIFAADAGLGVISTGNTTTGSAVVTGIPASTVDVLQAGWAVSGNGIPGNTSIKSINAAAHSITMTATATASSTNEAIEYGGPYSYPTELFDFNPVNNTISLVSPALPDANLKVTPSYSFRMLMLPTGQLLLTDSSQQLWVYTPVGSTPTTYLPTVTSVKKVSGNEYQLTGTQITGQSAGASYGDDAQMDENYPIVRLVSSTGDVYYTKTTNWSTAEVATGSASETVDFTYGSSVPAGKYSLIVSAAGIQSKAFSFTVP